MFVNKKKEQKKNNFLLTRCGYAKCQVTLIDEPAKNDVLVKPL